MNALGSVCGRAGGLARPVQGEMGLLLNVLQRADATPTGQVVAACKELQKMPTGLLGRWRELRNKELPALNEKPGAAKPPPPPLGGEEKAR